jgi:2-dehydro-3-deoxyphosphooctonate aldolase (KDO 8-P synthase)
MKHLESLANKHPPSRKKMKNKTQFQLKEFPHIQIGQGRLLIIAGPCVIEDVNQSFDIAAQIKDELKDLPIDFIFKSSFDKANRSSIDGFRGVGLEKGLDALQRIKKELNIPVLTDVHEISQVQPVAEVVDMLQTPAFLCRQTDFIIACAQSGRPVNFKKGQFLSPQDAHTLIDKARKAAQNIDLEDQFMLCERGCSFGYQNLVVDMRGLVIMRQTGAPIIFDATHSVQLPGGQGTSSGGQREFVPPLARAAAAVGLDGFFLETHPDPRVAKSDAPNLVPLKHLRALLAQLIAIHDLQKSFGTPLEDFIQTW